jgi:hypothetical protein|tara:strand:- start:845 stop:1105 length:261 start_codon:yes stop_codon:yes gene_type:complete
MITAEQYNKLREKEILDLTNKYKSSDNEVSVVKGIPISLLSKFKTYMKVMNKKVRFRYRGPSTEMYRRNPSFIHMNAATSFAIYKK